MAQFCRKRRAEPIFIQQHSIFIALPNTQDLSSLPPSGTPIAYPFGTKYENQQGKPWSINLKDEYEFSFDFLTFVHFTSYSFVLRVFDSQSELSRFFLTFVPCLLLLLASITLSLSSLAYHHTFTFHFSWTYTGTL